MMYLYVFGLFLILFAVGVGIFQCITWWGMYAEDHLYETKVIAVRYTIGTLIWAAILALGCSLGVPA